MPVFFVWYIFPGGVNEPNTLPVNILNVEIKTRNIPLVLSHFHIPEDEWAILSVEWVLVADNLSL